MIKDIAEEIQLDCTGRDMMVEGYFAETGGKINIKTEDDPIIYHNWFNCICPHMQEIIKSGKESENNKKI